MDWKKLSGKAAQYAADGAAEKTVEFALTKVGPYRVAGIIAKLLMFGALVIAAGGWACMPTPVTSARLAPSTSSPALVFVDRLDHQHGQELPLQQSQRRVEDRRRLGQR